MVQVFENKRTRKSPKIHLARGRGRDTQIVVRKAKSSPSSRRVVRAGHQAPTGRWGAGGRAQADRRHHRPPPLESQQNRAFLRPENKRGVRGDLAIGRCPGGTKGSLTPHEDRPGRHAYRPLTPPCRRRGLRPRPRHGRLAASKIRVCSRWTCFARQFGPWSGRPPRSTDRDLPHRAPVHANPFPDTPDPCLPPVRSSRPGTMCELRSDRSESPRMPRLSFLVRRFRLPQVLGPTRGPPAVAAERTGPLRNPRFPTQPESLPGGADPSAPFVSPWRGLALGEPDDRRDTNELLHPLADFRPHPVQPLLKTAYCPFRPRRIAFRRRLLPVDGASALG